LKIDSASDDQLVRVLVAEWDNHKLVLTFSINIIILILQTMTMIRDVLMYMDKTYCEREGRPLVFQTGVRLFCEIILARPSCKNRLQSVLLRNVHCERRNEPIDQELIKHCLLMLVECGSGAGTDDLYANLFETAFLGRFWFLLSQRSDENQRKRGSFIVKRRPSLSHRILFPIIYVKSSSD